MTAFADQISLSVATGASGARRARLPRGRLTHVSAVTRANSPPVRLSITIVVRAQFSHLMGGWLRGEDDPAQSMAISWDGDVPIPRSAELDLSLRNDTGSTVEAFMWWVGETV